MNVYEFTLVIETQAGLDDGLEDALFEAGCDDATLSFRKGIAYLDFDREAEDLESAIISAIQQVEQTGLNLWVKRVEPSDLVTSAEIARRLDRSRQSIQQLISGARGEGKKNITPQRIFMRADTTIMESHSQFTGACANTAGIKYLEI